MTVFTFVHFPALLDVAPGNAEWRSSVLSVSNTAPFPEIPAACHKAGSGASGAESEGAVCR